MRVVIRRELFQQARHDAVDPVVFRTAGHLFVEGTESTALAVDPCRHLAMVAAQVTILVGHHRQHFFRRRAQQIRQAQNQVIGMTAKQAPARPLEHRRIELIVNDDMMDRRPFQFFLNLVQYAE